MSRKRKTILKIEITLLVFIAILTALTMAFVSFGDNAPAPQVAQGTSSTSGPMPYDPTTATNEPPDVTGIADNNTTPDIPVTHEPEQEPPENPYITLQLEEHNIATGDLILVNPDYYYETPDSVKLVSVAENKTRSYVLLDGNAKLAEKIMKPLNSMMDDFYAETGISNVLLNSTFRTPQKQQAVFNEWVNRVGRKEAARMAAAPGHSEHHTGLAFDLAIYSGGTVSTFKGTGKYAWIQENSHKYGFVLRYPDSKQEITRTAYEPWHFRYIGVPHAYLMEKNDFAFEEYMEYLMSFPFEGTHLLAAFEGVMYEIYYVRGTSVPVPKDYRYIMSGNNIDGFIVTVNRGEAVDGETNIA